MKGLQTESWWMPLLDLDWVFTHSAVYTSLASSVPSLLLLFRSALIKWKCFSTSAVLNWFPFTSCCPHLCLFPSLPPLSHSFLLSEPFPETAGHTVMTLISLSASVFLSLTHAFSVWLFFPTPFCSVCSPVPSICAAVCSTFISLPHVSHFFSPPLH